MKLNQNFVMKCFKKQFLFIYFSKDILHSCKCTICSLKVSNFCKIPFEIVVYLETLAVRTQISCSILLCKHLGVKSEVSSLDWPTGIGLF